MADVQTNTFMLSSATLMVAPAFTKDVFSLTPVSDSVGLCEQISVKVDGSEVQLKNGIAQVVVDSKRTGVTSSITGNIMEFNAKNMLVAAGLSDSPVSIKRGKLTTALAAAAVSLSVATDPVPGDSNSDITATTDIPSGATIIIQRAGSETDYTFVTKSSGAATGSGSPYTVPIAAPYAVPAGMSFPVGSHVWIVNEIPVGSVDADSLFGVKIVGTLSNFDRPVVYIAPKVKISKGLDLSFTETAYGSMPWEMTPQLLTASEATGRLAEIGTRAPGRVYIGG